MNKTNKLQLLLFVFILPFTQLVAQKQVKIAGKQIEFGQFQQAATTLAAHISKNPSDVNATLMMAECQLNMGNAFEAVTWYEKYSQLNPSDKAIFYNKGNALKMCGRYNDAITAFKEYGKVNPAVSSYMVNSCNNAIALMQNGTSYNATPLTANTDRGEFASSLWNNKLIYCTFAPQDLDVDALRSCGEGNGFSLVTSEMDGSGSTLFANGIKFTYNMGPISQSGNKCVYAFYGSSVYQSARPYASSIYLGESITNNDLTNVSTFPYNEVGVVNCDPFLTNEGKTLFFSSNKSGGMGGFDIYMSKFANNKWSEPINLGTEINTVGNEITPNVNGDIMYFSSDYHAGLGGYDIFSAQRTAEGWMNIQNAGVGVNSSAHDYFPYITNERTLYLTSQRLNSKGSDDIFQVKLNDRNTLISFGEPRKKSDISMPEVEIKSEIQKEQVETLEKQEIVDDVVVSAEETPGSMQEKDMPKAVSVTNYMPTAEVAPLPTTTVKLVRDKSGKIAQRIIPTLQSDIAYEQSITPPPAFRIPDFSNNAVDMDELMSDARRVSLNEVMSNKKTVVYFVQIAALYGTRPNFDKYRKLTVYGNVYKVFINKSVKVRIGYYDSVDEAQFVLAKVRSEGYQDAFMVTDDLVTSELELVLSGSEQFNGRKSSKSFGYASPSTKPAPTKPTTSDTAPQDKSNNITDASEYKVRLVSYEDPIWFESGKVKDIGKVEHWKKGTWTIFILSGFKTYEEAENARIKAVNRGFKDAEVVIDNGGIIERLKKN